MSSATALCPWCFESIALRHDGSFVAHVQRCKDAPPEAKAAYRRPYP